MIHVPTQRNFLPVLAGFLVTATLAHTGMAMASDRPVLDLQEAQARAQAYSPSLAAVSLGQQATAARRDQAGRWQNPDLALEWEDFAGSGEFSGLGASVWTLAVSQVFDLSGKHRTAQDLFSEEISLLDWERQSVHLDLQEKVGLAFGEVWFAQEAVALVKEQRELAIRLQAELQNRFEAGGGSPIEVTRARVGVSAAQVALVQAEERLRTARRYLTSLWGGEASDFERVVLPSNFWDRPEIPATLASVSGNPDLARWKQVRSLQDAQLKAVKAAAGVDLEMALGVKLEQNTGTSALVLAAGLPLPVSNRNQDEIRALGYDLERVAQLKLENENTILTQLEVALENQQSTRQEMDIMAVEIIPLARQAYDETRTAHQRGLFSLTDVLETRRNLFELLQVELETQLRFYNAAVGVARLTGGNVLDTDPVSSEVK